jgi:TRAP-type C4-dicarboxylate transport system substrate-binding protein
MNLRRKVDVKKRIVMLFVLIAALALAACGNTAGSPTAVPTAAPPKTAAPVQESTAPAQESADDTVYTLIVHQHDSATSGIGLFLEDWTAQITEASGNRLQFEIYNGGALGSAKDTIDMIQNRTCDIGWGLQAYFTGNFDGSQVIMCPMLGIKDAAQGSKAFWELYKNNAEVADEYKDFHVLMLHTSLNSPISTKSIQIDSIDQFKGMKVRCNSGAPTLFVQNLGATPVSVAIGELYQAIENNTIDALITDWQANKAFSLYEPQNYYLDECIHVTSYFMLMNQDSYAELPPDLQAVLDQYSGDAAVDIVGSYWAPFEVDCKALIEAKGGTIYQLSDGEREKMQEIANKTCQDWVDSISASGYDGQKLLDDCIKYVNMYA